MGKLPAMIELKCQLKCAAPGCTVKPVKDQQLQCSSYSRVSDMQAYVNSCIM